MYFDTGRDDRGASELATKQAEIDELQAKLNLLEIKNKDLEDKTLGPTISIGATCFNCGSKDHPSNRCLCPSFIR
jgi:hypothetical protein